MRTWVEGGLYLLCFAGLDAVLWKNGPRPPWETFLCTGIAWLIFGGLVAAWGWLRNRYSLRLDRSAPRGNRGGR